MTAISYRPPHRVGRGIQRSLEIPRRLTAFLLCFLMGGALTVGVTSCGSSTTTSTAPSARTDKCQVQAQLDHATFPASGGTGTLHVSINRECSWNAESDAAWLALSSGGSGQGDGTVQFTVATNSAPATRTAGITVNDQRMQISQDGRPCDFRLSSTSEQVDPAGGERTLQVTASNSQCTWTATADVPWITFAGASSGSGSGTVVFRVASTNGALRTGTVTVAGLRTTVVQSAGCSYAVDPSTYAAPASGGPGQLTVLAGEGCPWSAVSDAEWVGIAAGTGSGPGVVRFSVASSGGVPRTASIHLANLIVTISQASGCTVSIAPNSLSLGSQAGTGTIQVSAGSGCSWLATSGADWLTISAGASGTGDGQVQVAVASNTGPARQGSVTIADHTVSIAQASGCAVAVAPNSLSLGSQAGSGNIQVNTASGCSWAARSGATWITISAGASGTGGGQVQIAVASNTGPAPTGIGDDCRPYRLNHAGQRMRVQHRAIQPGCAGLGRQRFGLGHDGSRLPMDSKQQRGLDHTLGRIGHRAGKRGVCGGGQPRAAENRGAHHRRAAVHRSTGIPVHMDVLAAVFFVRLQRRQRERARDSHRRHVHLDGDEQRRLDNDHRRRVGHGQRFAAVHRLAKSRRRSHRYASTVGGQTYMVGEGGR